MTDSNEIKELRYFNTPTEPIHITGLPLNEIPPDTPNYLTDRTYVDIIEGLSAGIPVSKTLSLIGCDYIMTGRIITWFYADDDRKREYLSARAIGSEVLADEMIEIADGVVDENNPIPEDVARSKLKIDTRRFLITVNNRPRFDKVVNVNVKVDLVKALEDANNRVSNLIDSDILEGEVIHE